MGLIASVAQVILDGTTVDLGKVAMYPCSNPHAELKTSAQIHIPGPFGATVHPFKYTMSTRGCPEGGEWHCDNPKSVDLGYFTAPELHLKPGHNDVSFTTGATLSDSTNLLNNFVLPMFFEGTNATLALDGEDMDITVLKIPLKKLHLKNTLTCYKVELLEPSEVPAQYCPNASSTQQSNYQSSGYMIKCKDHKGNKEVSIVV
jgi:hypothetical protein